MRRLGLGWLVVWLRVAGAALLAGGLVAPARADDLLERSATRRLAMGKAPPAETRSGEQIEHMSLRRLTVEGTERGYFYYEPESLKGKSKALVMVFHGGQGDGRKIAEQTDFIRVADRQGFALVFPNSLEYWNDGRATTSSTGNDIVFVRRLIDTLVEREGVDRRRVYATGASNGGMFTLRLACEMSGEIAAFAPVIASFPQAYVDRCKPQRAVPILMVNGTADEFMPWSGGSIKKGLRRGAGGEVISVPQTVEFWRRHNACAAQAETRKLPDIDRNDQTTAELLSYDGCRDQGQVQLIRIEGGGHTWPGSQFWSSGMSARMMGKTSQDLNASEVIWSFFKDRSTPAARGH